MDVYLSFGQTFDVHIPALNIARGEHIAICGRSGEGKTTLLNLLSRNLTPLSGQIKLDGIAYPDVREAFFEKNITYISQDADLFDRSLYDNIVLGRNVDDEKLKSILAGCQLEELLAKLNDDIHRPIGEKGIRVSTGERQRINIARGLLMDRDVLILDEITANLDPVTTQKIWAYIFKTYKDRTIIAISHEKELLKYTSRTLKFDKGRLT